MKKIVRNVIAVVAVLLLVPIGVIICFYIEYLHSPDPIQPLFLEVEQSADNPEQIIFGSMQLTIPVGWKYETRAEGENTCLVLIDAHNECQVEGVNKHSSLYNHEIIISPYELVEDFDEPMELLAVLMETFQSDKIHSGMGPEDSPDRSMYIGTISDEDSFTNHFFFLSYNKREGRQELFVVSEEKTLARANVVEDFYYDFLREGCMSLYNGMVIIDTPWINSYVFSLEQGAERAFLSATRIKTGVVSARVYDEEMQMLTEFSYERKYSDEIPYWYIEDLNQDGYSDIGIAFRNEEWYQAYEGYLWNAEKQEFDFVQEQEFEEKYKEMLLSPEMQPQIVITEQDRIPEGLINELSDALKNEERAVSDILEDMAEGKPLTEDELAVLSKESQVLRKNINYFLSEPAYRGIWLMQDADNDGVDDVLLQVYLGGSMGSVFYYLFKGEEEGDYREEVLFGSVLEKIAFIKWEGKNYLVQLLYDYSRKEEEGFRLTAFKDGQVSDTVVINRVIADKEDAHHVKIDYLAEEIYRDTLGNTIFNFSGGYEVQDIPQGTAECRQSGGDSLSLEADIDNDGVKEPYYKTVWLPSNYYAVAGLRMLFDEESEGELLEKTINEEESPLFLWVDETQWGNVTYVLYEDNLYDFHICAYLLTEENCELLMRVSHTFDLDVETIRETDF